MAETHPVEHWEPLPEHPPQHLVGGLVVLRLAFYGRPEVVRRPSSAEENPAVEGPRQVVDGEAHVGHALAPGPADLGPSGRVDRFGQDDQRVDREQEAAEFGKLGQVGLAGEDDDIG